MEVGGEIQDLPFPMEMNLPSDTVEGTGQFECTDSTLTVTTTAPQPEATLDNTAVQEERWISLGTGIGGSDNARLRDLLTAFNRLDVPVEQQIDIIRALHRNGQLHAKLVID